MKLFDRKYLHCIWSEEIDGKECLISDNLSDLVKNVDNGKALDPDVIQARGRIKRSDGVRITDINGIPWVYAYYDPNYSVKVAYNEGKQIQAKSKYHPMPWADCKEQFVFDANYEYRVKPEEPEEFKRMTYRQLSEWLAKGNGQCKTYAVVSTACLAYDDFGKKDNREVSEDYKIRCWGSDEWIEPTLKIFMQDCRPL